MAVDVYCCQRGGGGVGGGEGEGHKKEANARHHVIPLGVGGGEVEVLRGGPLMIITKN